MTNIDLQPHMVKTISETFPEGTAWIVRLPETLKEICDRWHLIPLPAYPDLSYHYVAPVSCEDGSSAVLKIGVPHDELKLQIEALSLYEGRGMARLLKSDAEAGAMLLERLEPGVTLWSLCNEENDAALTETAALVMRRNRFSAPPTSSLPTVEKWMQELTRLRGFYGGGTGPFPLSLVEKAEYHVRELLKSAPPSVLLHGDLHHGNLLSATRNGVESWLAIDPHGVIGDPAFEPATFLHNPLPLLLSYSDPRRALQTRLDIFSDVLEIERERIQGWGIAHAVLATWWGVEDGGEVNLDCLRCGEWLS